MNRFLRALIALTMLLYCQVGRTQCPTEPAELYLVADNLNPTPGSQICYRVFARGFQNVVSVQFTISFTTNSLAYSSDDRNLVGIPNFGDSFLPPDTDPNIYRVFWFDSNAQPNSSPDGPLFEICFDVIGSPGEEIRVEIGREGLQSPMEVAYVDDQSNQCPDVTTIPILDLDSYSVPSEIIADCTGGIEVFTNEICGTPSTIDEGRVRLDIFCGTAPYTFTDGVRTISNITDDFYEVTDLPDGTNIFTITDATGQSTGPIQVEVQVASLIGITAQTIQPRCFDEQSPRGSISLDITGGSPFAGGQYDFDWGGPRIGRDERPSIDRVGNGDYTVIIRDSLGCAATQTFSLMTTEVEVIPSSSPAFCDGQPTGTLTLTGSGGNPNANPGYRFRVQGTDNLGNLFDRSMVSSSNTFTFTNIPAGDYMVWAEDEDLVSMTCAPVFVNLTVASEEAYSLEALPNPDVTATCSGADELSTEITLTNSTVSSGTTYSYQIWSIDNNGAASLQVSSAQNESALVIIECLMRGEYEMRIQDSDGCEFVERFIVDGCDLSLIGLGDPVLCTDLNSGSATVLISGGTTPYSVAWPNGETTETITGLATGSYQVTVTDANLCIDSVEVTLFPPEVVTVDINASGTISCPGELVDLSAVPSGGFDPYMYRWDPDPTSTTGNLLSGVGAGTYSVTVTDVDGCEGIGSITIDEPTPPSFNLQPPVAPSCQGDNSGVTNISVLINSDFGGDFLFEASSGEQGLSGLTFSPTQLPAGDQWILVTHQSSGCVFDTVHFVVPEGQPIELDTATSDFGFIECFGDEGFVTLDAVGNVNVSFEWPDPINIVAAQAFVPAGMYTVTLTAGACTSIDSFEVVQPDEFVVAVDPFASSPPSCPNDLGNLVANRVGGVDPISVRWVDENGTTVSSDLDLNGVGPGEYIVTATDANGCTSPADTAIVTVSEPIEVFLGTPIDPFCSGDLGQIFIDSIRGGTAPYRYQIESSAARDASDTSDVTSGPHFITVFDFEGCRTDTINFTIATPEEVSISISGDQLVELGRTGILSANPVSPVAIDTVIWTSDDPDATFTCLTNDCTEIEISPVNDATYTATIINIDSCTASNTITVDVNRSQNVYAPNIFNPASVIDPANRVFQIYAGSGVESIDYLRIFDRWGNLVHEEINLPIPLDGSGSGSWDGTLMNGDVAGKPLESGVYVFVYQVRFLGDNTPDIRKGDVTLIR